MTTHDAGAQLTRRLAAALIMLGAVTFTSPAHAVLDLCGCAGSPASLGEFRSSIEATYPPGATRSDPYITIPLPEGGRLIFDSFVLDGLPGNPSGAVYIRFTGNAANDPVRLLVAGDVTVPTNSNIDVSGYASAGTYTDPRGGIGGPGGFRGGDGANEPTTLTRIGGYGQGPGGGAPGVSNVNDPSQAGQSGTFVGNYELMPLIGGSGGGGSSVYSSDCNGGGGGGGGGAILIAANGKLTLNGLISSNGAPGVSGRCGGYSGGGGGSAGAIRLVADTIAGDGSTSAISSLPGVVRVEAFDISSSLTSNPPAIRSFAPAVEGPAPTIAITAVNGKTQSRVNDQPIAEQPQGVFGGVDVIVSGGSPVSIDVASDGLAGGTTVDVIAKGRTGGARITVPAVLGNCTPQGHCSATAVFQDAPSGTYFVEAKASFH